MILDNYITLYIVFINNYLFLVAVKHNFGITMLDIIDLTTLFSESYFFTN